MCYEVKTYFLGGNSYFWGELSIRYGTTYGLWRSGPRGVGIIDRQLARHVAGDQDAAIGRQHEAGPGTFDHGGARRERWPAAFPIDDRKVRPLATVTASIAEAMGWTLQFTHGLLSAGNTPPPTAERCCAMVSASTWRARQVVLGGRQGARNGDCAACGN
jgi:hypothetical protein